MEIDDANVVAEWLSAKRGQKVYIRVPKKGQREKLVELAEQNAVMVLTQDKEKFAGKKEGPSELSRKLQICWILAMSNEWKPMIFPTRTVLNRLVRWSFMNGENLAEAIIVNLS